jgi:hypothetical protein
MGFFLAREAETRNNRLKSTTACDDNCNMIPRRITAGEETGRREEGYKM